MLRQIKSIRNALSDFVAMTIDRYPRLESPCIALGKAFQSIPLLCKIYPRIVEKLRTIWSTSPRRFRKVRIEGLEFLFDVTDFTACGLFFYGKPFEHPTTSRLTKLLHPGATILDVGANKGYFTILSALVVGSRGRVYAFEPNPIILDGLREHIQYNALNDRVHVDSSALSSSSFENAKLYLSSDPFNSGLASLTPFTTSINNQLLSHNNMVLVSTTTLDGWLAQQGDLGSIDVIKVDVEGAEELVLDGAQRTLQESPPKHWIIETSLDSPIVGRLEAHGYHSEVLEQAGELANILFTHRSVLAG
jgi:FkbM family methyltransferase